MLWADLDPGQPGPVAVTVSALSAPQQAALNRVVHAGGSLLDVLNVRVVDDGVPHDDARPPIAGRHQVVADGLRFLPHFPPEPGVLYRATFRPELLDDAQAAESISLQFRIPEPQPLLSPTVVERIYPSGDYLPENLLRLYVAFSRPMWRGCAVQHMQLLGPDGEPAPDVLYRAPVELWDRSMQTLTVLLDPGRLKRGVGPNRELGPPLVRGECYTLVVGAGMLDGSGQPLARATQKSFRVLTPVREPIAVEQWRLSPPTANTSEALVFHFQAPLDWALLTNAITINKATGERVDGHIMIGEGETRWSLTPTTPWTAGFYRVCVRCDLEDVCGNSPVAPFDRPLRQGSNLYREETTRELHFNVI